MPIERKSRGILIESEGLCILKTESYDAVILGAGLYGLFSALRIVEGG